MNQAGVFVSPSGEIYRDRKRYLWALSVLVPMLALVGPGLFFITGNALWLWAPLAFYFVVIPMLDMALSEDTNNPPKEVVAQLEQDCYFSPTTVGTVITSFQTGPRSICSVTRVTMRIRLDAISLYATSTICRHCRTVTSACLFLPTSRRCGLR